MKIVDDFLPVKELNELHVALKANTFPWFMGNPTTYNLVEDRYNIHFSHVFYTNFSVNSEYINLLEPLLQRLCPLALIRVKANITTNTAEIIETGFHVDIDSDKCKTAVFYVNSNDGYTAFADGQKVQSVANRMVIFDTQTQHTGTTTTDKPYRLVINFNYIPV